jgi:hypothetical protein
MTGLTTPDMYETLLAEYSNHEMAMLLLQQHRPYMEMVPSIRRSRESIMTLPLPAVKIRGSGSVVLPCDLAYLLCDPEWKIKMGGEIIVLIQRPDEHFSELLGRWRQTQVTLDCDYEWHRPNYYRQIMTEGSDRLYPLFVLYPDSDQRLARGLRGAHLPFVISNLLGNLSVAAENNLLISEDCETAEDMT